MSKCILGVVLTGLQSERAQICVWNADGVVDSLTLSRNGNYSGVHYLGEFGVNIERKQRVIKITPLYGVLCCLNVNKYWHGAGGYSQGVFESQRKSATISYPESEEGQPTIEFEEFPPCEMVPKHWISIVNTPSGHAIILENGAIPLFGHTGILRFHTIEEMREKKKVGSWSFHLGSPSLPIIMEITRIAQSATEEHNGNCDIVFRPVDGSLIRCFNGNPHFMGQHLQECSGFQVSLEWQISNNGPRDFEVTNVTYLPLEQDK